MIAMTLGLFAPAALAQPRGGPPVGGGGHAQGQDIINQPRCEALGGEWSRDRGTASCVYTEEIDLGRVVDYERELYDLDLTLFRQDLTLGELLDLVDLAEDFTDVDLGPLGPVLGLIPDALRDLDIGYLRVSVEGQLILTVELDLMLLVTYGASQQGVIGAPGTSDTYRPVFDLGVDAETEVYLGWESCVVAAYAGYDGFTIPTPWFLPNIPVPGDEFEVIEVDVPGLVCTTAMIVDILFIDN
ncbi:hypothetical protein [Egicoccus halophilus]|uniref:hypothetical protein n=1 Tax=Egicoccus halophilus TaxID=1670830 RepID=UPI0010325A07|nr:hypothetical protein [Egicoccus halophilus]